MKIYIATEIAKQMTREPVPGQLVSYAEYLELEQKLTKAKSCLKLAIPYLNPNGFLLEDILKLLQES